MLPLRKILCPTDFSEPSYRALAAAAELAGQYSAEILLVYAAPAVPVFPAPAEGTVVATTTFNVPEYQKEMDSHSEQMLAEVRQSRLPGDLKVTTHVLHDDPAGGVLDLADREGVDLIVIATHGRTGWRRFVFGSVAEKVVRYASCPVLTVRPAPEG